MVFGSSLRVSATFVLIYDGSDNNRQMQEEQSFTMRIKIMPPSWWICRASSSHRKRWIRSGCSRSQISVRYVLINYKLTGIWSLISYP